jgi:hypothetical protein
MDDTGIEWRYCEHGGVAIEERLTEMGEHL